MKNTLSPQQAARALGVSESSLKRWCDQGLLKVVRTPGGHRRLEPGAVLAFVRATGRRLDAPELLGLPAGLGRPAAQDSSESLQTAIQAGAEEECRRLLFEKYLAGATLAEICDDDLAPALHSIGAAWEHGRLDVFEEHRGAEIALRSIQELRQALPAFAVDAPRALGGAAEGDPYRAPTAMVELVLREMGWRAESYGPLLPAASLCEAIRRLRPRLAWISVSSISDEAAFLAGVDRVYQTALEHGSALVLGGQALSPALRKQVQASACCDSMRQLVGFVRELHPAPPPQVPSRN